jgi:hypothetical protein
MKSRVLHLHIFKQPVEENFSTLIEHVYFLEQQGMRALRQPVRQPLKSDS